MSIPIVWGQKQQVAQLGYAADYCAICRELRPFAVRRVSVVSHVYWIPTGKSRPVSRVGSCTVCGTTMPTDSHQYTTLVADPGQDAHRLARTTYPAALKVLQQQEQLAQQARQGRLPFEVRMQLLSQPFQLLAPLVESLYARRANAPRPSAIAVAAALFSPVHVFRTEQPTGVSGSV